MGTRAGPLGPVQIWTNSGLMGVGSGLKTPPGSYIEPIKTSKAHFPNIRLLRPISIEAIPCLQPSSYNTISNSIFTTRPSRPWAHIVSHGSSRD